ncbi:MAG: 50S ribosomal protein L31 [Candidatus Yonathbacteria bacterium RIFCSPHIGHO2_01_FULL_51_10]|uniref:Large ribosomal subunit protein bL31 n=1 Tax=Candidatus Yonathbacteria bacterium RIFCSPHIGHO2_01_FULL_51_10 TaxID=1802723 RepID=A0A1G2S4W0_9BACT|nr:MAG: 50S ribosomal protein L31 [Candidatus Yonathbacteria bacterium RIFCSPHIGHO2_01_FULL_51_10]
MKADIHPTYHNKAKVDCACGASFTVGSTLEKIRVETCSSCHPFFTGEEKIMDTGGRVERFKKRTAAAGAGSAKKGK